MSTIDPITRQKIKAYLEVFIENAIARYKTRTFDTFDTPSEYLQRTSVKGTLKPFHDAILVPEFMRITAFERSFSTSLGSNFEECARLIALDYHQEAKRGYDVAGIVSDVAVKEIENQVSIFEHAAEKGVSRPTFESMIAAVIAADNSIGVERKYRADLYIKTKDDIEYFFEMKSPKPNKGQCIEVTQRLLRFHLLRGKKRPDVQCYFALPYNPYGSNRSNYKWAYTLNYTPFDQAVVIGHEFWDIVGGIGVYEELLEIYQEVGHDKSKYMLDALAFGF